MSKIIEQPKKYTGVELSTVFFRPMLSGPSAVELGIRLLYNMPVPTTLNFWKRNPDALKAYAKGFQGGSTADRFQKTIALSKVKAEMSYTASDYFSMVYEQIVGRADVNMSDLGGTELEAAETELFARAIAESIRATMWVGDTTRAAGFNTFDGLLKAISKDAALLPTAGDSVWRVHTPYLDFSARLDSAHLSADVVVRDTLIQVLHRVPRFIWLGIAFGTKGVRQEIVSKNPHTQIVAAEYLKIVR